MMAQNISLIDAKIIQYGRHNMSIVTNSRHILGAIRTAKARHINANHFKALSSQQFPDLIELNHGSWRLVHQHQRGTFPACAIVNLAETAIRITTFCFHKNSFSELSLSIDNMPQIYGFPAMFIAYRP